MEVIYSRVSTNEQDTRNQVAKLTKIFPDASIVEEVASGAKARPKLRELISKLVKGDVLIVAALDRLGRKTSEILQLIEDLDKRGVILKSIREGVDYSTPTGRLVTQILCSVAELERSLISERTKTALAAKKSRGIRLGRKQTYPAELLNKARELRRKGMKLKDIAAQTGISIAWIARIAG